MTQSSGGGNSIPACLANVEMIRHQVLPILEHLVLLSDIMVSLNMLSSYAWPSRAPHLPKLAGGGYCLIA